MPCQVLAERLTHATAVGCCIRRQAVNWSCYVCVLQDVLQLSGLQKVTARLIEAVEVVQTEQKFDVNFVTIVPFFKVILGPAWCCHCGAH
jgi:hypothetical protein